MQTETEDRWYVEVGGAPKMMTLDELVEAFEASTINSKTLVCEVGGSEWKPLSDVADLGDDEEEAPLSQQAPALAGYVTPSKLPPAPAPRSVAPVPVGASSAFPQAVARQTLSAWPPAVNTSRPPAFGSVPPMSAPSNSVVPPSTMPVVQDLSIPSDDEFKPRRSKAPYVAAAAVMLLVGGALGAAKFGGGGEVHVAVPVPAAAPPPVAVATETATSVAAATPPSTPAPTPSSDSTANTGSGDKDKASDSSDKRLSDDAKSKLKEADKTRADKKKTAKSSRGHAAARSKSSSSSSGVFRNGGSADDPLNSKL
jgi:hypothetical protein